MVTSISSSAVDGLVSGLDTASIISQLITVDAAPQTQMKNAVTTAQGKVTALQTVNTKMSALQTAAQNLSKASAWSAAKATSSSESVSVTAGAGAQPGNLNLYVENLATSRSVITAGVDPKVDAAQALGLPLDVVSADGTYLGKVDVSPGTLAQVAAQINKASSDLGIRAVAVRISENVYRLQITSTKSGAAGDFKLVPGTDKTEADVGKPVTPVPAEQSKLGLQEMSKAQDAKIWLTPGPVADGATPTGIEVESTSNTFSDLMPGVTLTATQKGNAAVSVVTDPSAISDSIKALVDAANAALTSIAAATKAGTVGSSGASTGAGALNGNSAVRELKTKIVDAVTRSLGGSGTSAAAYGLQSTRDGQLTFKPETFLAAYAADPAKAQKLLAPTSVDSGSSVPGVVDRLIKVAQTATGIDPVTNVASGSGSLELAIKGQNSSISDFTQRISDWDTRLAAKKAQYQKYYSSLEVSLGKLQSQQSWLTGQLASLST